MKYSITVNVISLELVIEDRRWMNRSIKIKSMSSASARTSSDSLGGLRLLAPLLVLGTIFRMIVIIRMIFIVICSVRISLVPSPRNHNPLSVVTVPVVLFKFRFHSIVIFRPSYGTIKLRQRCVLQIG